MAMYRHLLVPVDGSETAAKAVAAAIEFARQSGAKLTFVTALPRYRGHFDEDGRSDTALTIDEHDRRTRELAERILGAPAEAARAAGVECETLYLQNERPYQAILDAAELGKCDLIVMASHGRRGLDGLVHGSETRKVLTHSKVPTLVYR
jgi:nucleotide-binding universal stress UspA family protein